MLRLVETRPGVCSVGYDDTCNAVVITWTKNDNDAFQPMLETQLRLVQQHSATAVIVDTSETTGTVNAENMTWLGEDYFPRLSTSGLRTLITVVPRSATTLLVNRRSFRDRDVAFSIVEAQTLAEARALAASAASAA